MKSQYIFFISALFSLLLTSCVDDVASTPPRDVTLVYNWEAANLSGLDSGFIEISHQAGAATYVIKPTDQQQVIPNVIGNLVIHETTDIDTEGVAVTEQTYIVPSEQTQTEIILIAPKNQ